MRPVLPRLELTNRQRKVSVYLPAVEACANAALELSVQISLKRGGTLHTLEEVAVAIVSSDAMARIHSKFLQISGPTDVITFPYGEIVVCAEVATSQATHFGNTLDQELLTYIVHGFLHLSGHDDIMAKSAARMIADQDKIVRAVWKSFLASHPKIG